MKAVPPIGTAPTGTPVCGAPLPPPPPAPVVADAELATTGAPVTTPAAAYRETDVGDGAGWPQSPAGCVVAGSGAIIGNCGRCTAPRLGMDMEEGGGGCDRSPLLTPVALDGLREDPEKAPLVVDEVVAPPAAKLRDTDALAEWLRVTAARCTIGVAGTTSGAGRWAARPPLPAGGAMDTTGAASATRTTSGPAAIGFSGFSTRAGGRCDGVGGCAAACDLAGDDLAGEIVLAAASLLVPYTGALLLLRIGRASMTSPARLWERRWCAMDDRHLKRLPHVATGHP